MISDPVLISLADIDFSKRIRPGRGIILFFERKSSLTHEQLDLSASTSLAAGLAREYKIGLKSPYARIPPRRDCRVLQSIIYKDSSPPLKVVSEKK